MSPNPESNEPVVDEPQEAAVENATEEVSESSGVEVQTPEFQEFSETDGVQAQNAISRFH